MYGNNTQNGDLQKRFLRFVDSRYNVNDECEKCANVIWESYGKDKNVIEKYDSWSIYMS